MKTLVAAMFLLACAVQGAVAGCRDDQVWLRGDWGETRFIVEVADSPGERSRGLMFRKSLPRGTGMLFVYEQPQRASFWMKNTLIPLDMLFVDRSGTVTRVHHNAVPGDLTAIEGGADVFAVLEINGGLAESYGIIAGSQMRHPAFADGPSAWGC
ncbi:DUF192 domain-containing protein [Rhodobacteraceae bacterium F11138]|nr:DUF192 domain-containing protein [Rhodobacteraceae bacterium F11138]